MHIAIIGGGAAGCFAAVNVKRLHPEAEVTVYEAATKPLVISARAQTHETPAEGIRQH